MAFVYEAVPEEDSDFFLSMGLKNCWGNDTFTLTRGSTMWCADRERNAFIVGIGGGFDGMPHFHDLWWNGTVVRLETECGSVGNYLTCVDIIWHISRIPLPAELWDKRGEVTELIMEAFSADPGWCSPEFLRSVSVKIECVPELI